MADITPEMLAAGTAELARFLAPLGPPTDDQAENSYTDAVAAIYRAMADKSKLGFFIGAREPGEPFIVIGASDPASDGLVDIWCEAHRMAITMSVRPIRSLQDVIRGHNVAARMREWRKNHPPQKLPTLDQAGVTIGGGH